MKLFVSFIFLLVAIFVIPNRSEEIFADTSNYIEYTELIKADVRFNVESSFLYISNLSDFLRMDYYGVFLIYAVIGFFLKGVVIGRISNFPLISMAIYFSHYFVLHELIQIRIGAALTFSILSIWYLVKDKTWLFTLFAIISIWFHNSLFILFFVVILFHALRVAINDNTKLMALVMIALQLATLLITIIGFDPLKSPVDYLSSGLYYDKIATYIFEYEPGQSKFSYVKFFFFIVISIPGVFLLLKGKVDSLFIRYCILLNMSASIFYGFFFQYTSFGSRVSDIFIFFNIFTIPYYVTKFRYVGSVFAAGVLLLYMFDLFFVSTIIFKNNSTI